MTWIKTADFMPPTHEIIIFTDVHRNDHYGVLCGNYAKKSQRNKFWCHIFQQTYTKRDVIYWCEIPINKHLLRNSCDFINMVNSFLNQRFSEIEEKVLEEFREQEKEYPEWSAEDLVSIAVRNSLHRFMEALRIPTIE